MGAEASGFAIGGTVGGFLGGEVANVFDCGLRGTAGIVGAGVTVGTFVGSEAGIAATTIWTVTDSRDSDEVCEYPL